MMPQSPQLIACTTMATDVQPSPGTPAEQLAEGAAGAIWFCCQAGYCQSLASLAATSSLCRTTREYFRKQVTEEYMERLEAAAPLYTDVTCMPTQADIDCLAWLCNLVGKERVLAAALQLQCPMIAWYIPNVPEEYVWQLVIQGFQVSVRQLFAAVRSRVAGLEVWFKAARTAGFSVLDDSDAVVWWGQTDEDPADNHPSALSQQDMKDLIKAIYCNDLAVVRRHLRPNNHSEAIVTNQRLHALQLAANCQDPQAATLMLDVLLGHLGDVSSQQYAAFLEEFVTAAVRGHEEIVRRLAALPCMMQASADSPQQHRVWVGLLARGLRAAKAQQRAESVTTISELLDIHKHALLLAEAEYDLIKRQIANQPDDSVLATLYSRPTIVQRLPPADLQQLLCQAVQRNGSAAVVGALARARHNEVKHDAAALLRLCLDVQLNSEATQQLLGVRSIQTLSGDGLSELAEVALTQHGATSTGEVIVRGLLQLPAGRSLGGARICQLLQIACLHGSTRGLEALLRHPTARHVQSAQLQALLVETAAAGGTVPTTTVQRHLLLIRTAIAARQPAPVANPVQYMPVIQQVGHRRIGITTRDTECKKCLRGWNCRDPHHRYIYM